MAIIAILAAILIPVLGAARARAKLSACEANLYQHGRAVEMPESGVDTTHCPYPYGDDDGAYVDVEANYKGNDANYAPDAGTVRTYCIEHLARNGDGTIQVPLDGKFTVLRFGGGTDIVSAKAVQRWKKINGKWVQIDETGVVPVYPEIWHFPRDDFPP